MPSFKQIAATKNFVANHGNAYRAMRDAGYTHATAKNASNLTDSRAFKELINELIPQEEVGKELRLLLNSAKLEQMDFPVIMENDSIRENIEQVSGCRVIKIHTYGQIKKAYFSIPDARAKKDAIDMILKIRGEYAAQKVKLETDDSGLSNDELDQKIQEAEEKVRALKQAKTPIEAS